MARIAIIGGGSMGEALLAGLLRAGRQVKDLVVAERMPDRAKLPGRDLLGAGDLGGRGRRERRLRHRRGQARRRRVGGRRDRRGRRRGREQQRRAGPGQRGRRRDHGVLRVAAARRLAGDPGDAQRPGAGRWRASARWRRAGSPPPSSSRRSRALFDVRRRGARRCRRASSTPSPRCPVRARRTSSCSSRRWSTPGSRRACSRAVATDLAVQTMAGSAAMLLERLDGAADRPVPASDWTPRPPELRAIVTSPGGTTAAGLRELERGGLRAAVAAAVEAAKTRSEQLGITSE